MAGIGMPEIAVFDSPTVNAFATGMKKNDALVAVSTGLLKTMTKGEAEAVLAHEVSHVANGDMVTLSLIQGVVNTFVMFFARIVAQLLQGNRRGGGGGMGYFFTYMVAQSVFGFLASAIVMYFSRVREFKADEGGAKLAGKANMIAALERLNSQSAPDALPEQMAAFGIFGAKAKFGRLFMSHPPLPERIAALEEFNG
jgi:heat shock protein HtpX